MENQTYDTAPESAVAAKLAYDLGSKHQPQEIITSAGPVLLVPTGLRAQLLEHHLANPRRANAHITLYTAGDLAAYVKSQTVTKVNPVNDVAEKACTGIVPISQPTHHPVIFCDRETTSIVAILDYHGSYEPRWLDHTAKITFKPSHQFKRWKDANGKRMSQDAFARFLDEVAKDIVDPASSLVVSFAENLEIYATTVFKSAIKASSGETTFTFTDERKGDISTPVIEEFTLGIPLWQNGEAVAIRARLFHRVVADPNTGAKSLNFWFELRQLDEIADKLFEEEVASLKKDLAGIADIYMGTPPARPVTTDLRVQIDA